MHLDAGKIMTMSMERELVESRRCWEFHSHQYILCKNNIEGVTHIEIAEQHEVENWEVSSFWVLHCDVLWFRLQFMHSIYFLSLGLFFLWLVIKTMKLPWDIVSFIVNITLVVFHDLPMFQSWEHQPVITQPKRTPVGNQTMSGNAWIEPEQAFII